MKLVIKPHRPRQRVLVAVGVLILVVGAVAVAFHYGHRRSIIPSMGVASLQGSIPDKDVDLKRLNKDLLKQVSKLQHTVEIDRHARVEYRETVGALQSEIADLELDLAFYRDILSSTEAAKGPHVRGFKLRDYGGSGRFQYRLVLTHVNKDDKVANGHVDVEIRGHESDIKHDFPLTVIVKPDSGDLAFHFKHFRRIEGVIQLPEHFVPEEVHVAVYEDGRKKSSFNKIYNWAKLIN